MEIENRKILNLFRVRRTVLQMIKDRGYIVLDDKRDLEMSRSFFEFNYVKHHSISRTKLEIKRPKWNIPTDIILIIFVEADKDQEAIGVKSIRQYCERIKHEQIPSLILVLHDRLTPHAKQAIEIINNLNDIVTYFYESELIVNITEHSLVPFHEIISHVEAMSMLKKYNIKENQLPKIYKNDPISRYFGLQKHQIVKITRNSETSGRYITYRRCTF